MTLTAERVRWHPHLVKYWLGQVRCRSEGVVDGTVPLPEVAAAFYEDADAREWIIGGGERGGKTFHAALKAWVWLGELSEQYASRLKEKPEGEFGLIWIGGPDYGKARKCLDYIREMCEAWGMVRNHWGGDNKMLPAGFVTHGGIRVEIKSLKESETLGADAPDYMIVEEMGLLDAEAYRRARGRVAEKRGQVYASGSFEGSFGIFPELWELYQVPNAFGGKSYSLPSSANKYKYPGGEDDPEIQLLKRSMPAARFQERHEGKPCPPSGLVYPEFRPEFHGNERLGLEPGVDVFLAIDPGSGGSAVYAAMALQIVSGVVCIFDEIYAQTLVTSQIIRLLQAKPWWQYRKHGFIDIAGAARHYRESVIDEFRRTANCELNLRGQYVRVEDGIERFRSFLLPHAVSSRPQMMINPRTCPGLMMELGYGQGPLNEHGKPIIHPYGPERYPVDSEGVPTSDKPIDMNNHARKAVSYALVGLYGTLRAQTQKIQKVSYMDQTVVTGRGTNYLGRG